MSESEGPPPAGPPPPAALRREPVDPLSADRARAHEWAVALPDGSVVRARVPRGLAREQLAWALKPLFRGADFDGARLPARALPLISSAALTCAEARPPP